MYIAIKNISFLKTLRYRANHRTLYSSLYRGLDNICPLPWRQRHSRSPDVEGLREMTSRL